MENREPIDQTERQATAWQRLEAEYPTATPERREHIDELLDELEWEAGERQEDDHGHKQAR